jgi:predicted nucleic acid-binding Zn ribbon protein
MKTKNCPVCAKAILGRSDKKYCSDECRTVHHNEIRTRSEDVIAGMNKLLRKNRTILKNICPAGKAIVQKDILKGLGYQFHLFTSMYITSQKQVYYICYDVAMSPMTHEGKEHAIVVLWTEYRKDWDPWKT